MIDTHAHLDACREPAGELVARAREAGVERVIAIGTDIASSRTALELAETLPGVLATVGIHPHEAGGVEGGRVAELRHLLAHERAVAVGETGLDYHRELAPREAQRRLFEAHLELAEELVLPVVIHCRAAAADTAACLRGFGGTVVLHCFSELDLLPDALDRGHYVSFAGNVTYPKAGELRRAACEIPGDRLLVETDAPYLAPQAVRGRPNEPAFVVHTLRVVADARGVEPDELAAAVDANADRAFALA